MLLYEGDPGEAFPASDKAVSELAMKNMFLSLRQYLCVDFSAAITPISHAVQDHEQRLVETNICEMFMAHNVLVDTHNHHDTEIPLLK